MTRKSHTPVSDHSDDKATVTLPGIVQKIIPSFHPSQPEQAEIAVDGAQELYREIRITNELEDQEGHPVKLKAGAEVEIKIEAVPEATTQAKENQSQAKEAAEKEKARKKPS